MWPHYGKCHRVIAFPQTGISHQQWASPQSSFLSLMSLLELYNGQNLWGVCIVYTVQMYIQYHGKTHTRTQTHPHPTKTSWIKSLLVEAWIVCTAKNGKANYWLEHWPMVCTDPTGWTTGTSLMFFSLLFWGCCDDCLKLARHSVYHICDD